MALADFFGVSLDTLTGYELRHNQKDALLTQLQRYVHDRTATQALPDAATARQVTDALLSLSGVTRLIITHQLDASFLSQCDGILVMKNGHFEEPGTFSQLMNRKGTFYSLSTLSQ